MSLGHEVRVALIAVAAGVVLALTAQAATAQAATCGSNGVASAGSCLYTTVGTDNFTAPPYRPFVTFTTYGGSSFGWNTSMDDGQVSWGGKSKGTLAVNTGDLFQINVGGTATDDGDDLNVIGGFNGGGDSGTVDSPPLTCCSMGGAGASDIRNGTFGLSDRLIVAGGAGGVGRYLTLGNDHANGGEGGGYEGDAGTSGDGNGGGGGTQSGAGASPGTASSAGFGFGGDGGPGFPDVATPGAGGGGGYYGGGGTGSVSNTNTPGGGGGGSGYVTPDATDASSITGGAQARFAETGTGGARVEGGLDGAVMASWPTDPITASVTLTADKTGSVDPSTVVTFTADVSISTGALAQGSILLVDYANGAGNCPCSNLAQGGLEATDDGHMRYVAKLNSNSLFKGSNTIVATYGDTYGVIPDTKSSALSLTLNKNPQSIGFTSTAPTNATANGPTYNVAATATSGLPVTFSVASAPAGICSISGSTVSFTGAGTCRVDADQAGNATYAAAPTASQFIDVSAGNTQAITFTSSPPAEPTKGGTYMVSATGGGSGQPVTFTTGGPCSIDGDTVSFDDFGLCHIYADQAGGNGYAPAPQAEQIVHIGGKAQFITFQTTPPDNPQPGGTYTVKARASSGDPVALTLDFSSTGCTLSTPTITNPGGYLLTTATVSFTGAGTCVVDANQDAEGDLLYAPAPQVQQTIAIAALSQAITFTSTVPGDAIYGGSYAPSATGGASGNPVTFSTTTPDVCSLSAGTLSFVGVGQCKLDADQAGGGAYDAAATASQAFSVGQAPLLITAPDVTVDYGEPPVVGAPAYDGFARSDTADSLTTKPDCSASTDSTTPAGTYSGAVTCSGAVDPNYEISYASGTVTVNRIDSSISIDNLPSGAVAGGSFTPTYDTIGDGTPTTASSTPGTCTVDSGVVHFVAGGDCSLQATVSQGNNYKSATGSIQTFSIAKATVSLSSQSSGDVVLGDEISDVATIGGGASPSGQITFSVYGPADPTCSGPPLDTSTVPVTGEGSYGSTPFTPPATGTYRWMAVYSGDPSNAPASTTCADPEARSVVGAPPPDPSHPGGGGGGPPADGGAQVAAPSCRALAAKLRRQHHRMLSAGTPRKRSLIKRHRADTLRRLARLGC